MLLRHDFHQGETQSRAFVGRLTGSTEPPVYLEYVKYILGRDAVALVGDCDTPIRIRAIDPHVYPGIFGAVLDGVADQVRERAPQKSGIAAYECFQLEIAIYCNAFRLRLGPDFIGSVVCNLR